VTGPGERLAAGADIGAEDELDRSLRPRRLDDFIGQDGVKQQLAIFLEAARQRGEALDHVLLAGPPGLGKTSLAGIVAAELVAFGVAACQPLVVVDLVRRDVDHRAGSARLAKSLQHVHGAEDVRRVRADRILVREEDT